MIRIGELAKRTGVTPRTICYYEELDELRQLLEAEEARAALRKRFHASESNAERLSIVEAALPHVETQLELVRRRKQRLERLEAELVDKRKRILAAAAPTRSLTARV